MERILDRLIKQYHNKITADHISLNLHKEIYDLLLANGAVKTTLIRIICGVLKLDNGTVTFDGIDVLSETYRVKLGYLPQDFGVLSRFYRYCFSVADGSFKRLIGMFRAAEFVQDFLCNLPSNIWIKGYLTPTSFYFR